MSYQHILPHNLNLIVYSVISIGIVVTLVIYYFVWKGICRYHDEFNHKGYLFHWTVFLYMLAPLAIALHRYLPPNLHWAQIPIKCVSGSFLGVFALIHTIRLFYIREDKNLTQK